MLFPPVVILNHCQGAQETFCNVNSMAFAEHLFILFSRHVTPLVFRKAPQLVAAPEGSTGRVPKRVIASMVSLLYKSKIGWNPPFKSTAYNSYVLYWTRFGHVASTAKPGSLSTVSCNDMTVYVTVNHQCKCETVSLFLECSLF